MPNPKLWIAGLGVALVAGAAGGAVGRYGGPASKSRAPALAMSPDRPPADTVALERRLAELEHQVAGLGIPAAPRPTAAAAPATSDGRQNPVPAAPAVDDPVFEAAVRDVMERLEDERRSERQSRSDERRREAAERWSASLGEKLDLTEEQRQRLLAIAADYAKELGAARSADGERLSRDEWRQKSAELRAKSEAQVSQVLDPNQRRKYDALEESDKLGAAGGFRRR